MTIHIITPFAKDKDLGKAYNEACSLIPDTDWICITDYDVLFLTPETINRMYDYAEKYPDCFLTGLSNRVHPINTEQLFTGKLSSNTNITDHILIAQKLQGTEVKELKNHLSGFLMLFPKILWSMARFDEGSGCLGIDTSYLKKLKAAGIKTYVMQSVYIFHTYRLIQGIQYKEHLK